MLSIGLIGEIKSLNPYIKRIKLNPKIHISGKSSFGLTMHEDDLRLSIPEFNRIELVERSDILLINRFTLIPYSLLRDIIKKTKHIFTTEYPDLSKDQFDELIKLTGEAEVIFQLANPLFNNPAIRWMNDNFKAPAFMDISFFNDEPDEKKKILDLLLMLHNITGVIPKKTDAISFQSKEAQLKFNNLRLDFGNATIINLNTGKKEDQEFIIKIYSPGKTAVLNFTEESYLYNNSRIDLEAYAGYDEFDKFIENILSKTRPATTLDDYITILNTFRRIETKLNQFSV